MEKKMDEENKSLFFYKGKFFDDEEMTDIILKLNEYFRSKDISLLMSVFAMVRLINATHYCMGISLSVQKKFVVEREASER